MGPALQGVLQGGVPSRRRDGAGGYRVAGWGQPALRIYKKGCTKWGGAKAATVPKFLGGRGNTF